MKEIPIFILKKSGFFYFSEKVYFFMGEESFGFIKGDMLYGMQGTIFKVQIYLYIARACHSLRYALGYLHALYFIERDIVSF